MNCCVAERSARAVGEPPAVGEHLHRAQYRIARCVARGRDLEIKGAVTQHANGRVDDAHLVRADCHGAGGSPVSSNQSPGATSSAIVWRRVEVVEDADGRVDFIAGGEEARQIRLDEELLEDAQPVWVLPRLPPRPTPAR